MYSLTEGSIDKIMNGIDVDKPVLQILGNKKLSSSNSGERYRLLVSDGKRINSFTMLATQLNSMITDNILTEFSICQINRYAISMVNNAGKQKRVMVILNIEIKVPGEEVGRKIGNPTNADSEGDSKPAQSAAQPVKSPPRQRNDSLQKKSASQASTNDVSTTPIVTLSPYQNRWVIKARVVSKSDIRTWSNSRGEGKLFSMDLVDESGEIRCTAFRDQCDKFYDMLEIGKVYYISRAVLKTANKKFNNLKNDYEMTLNGDSEIVPCHDAGNDIPSLQFDFSPISDIEAKERNEMIDILGVVKTCGDIQTFQSRNTGREMTKRDVHLVDESNTMVCLTLWGTQAQNFNGSMNPVMAIKGVRIGEFNGGKNLSTISSTVIQLDPDIPAAHKLRGWFNSAGRNQEAKSLSKTFGGSDETGPWVTFEEAKLNNVGLRGAEVYTAKAIVNMIRVENSIYKSCPADNCKKKLVDQDNDMFRCEKCMQDFPNYRYRLLANLSLSDWSGNEWVTAFNDEAEKILGSSSQELGELHDNDNDAFLERFSDTTFKSFVFKLRVKLETFSDDERLKITCMNVGPIDHSLYGHHLLTKIWDLAGMGKV
ncbi:replication protein A 70 [Augochlora pura]